MKEKGALHPMKTQRGLLALMVFLFAVALFVGAGASLSVTSTTLPTVNIPADTEVMAVVQIHEFNVNGDGSFDTTLIGATVNVTQLKWDVYGDSNLDRTSSTMTVQGHTLPLDTLPIPFTAPSGSIGPVTITGKIVPTDPAKPVKLSVKFTGKFGEPVVLTNPKITATASISNEPPVYLEVTSAGTVIIPNMLINLKPTSKPSGSSVWLTEPLSFIQIVTNVVGANVELYTLDSQVIKTGITDNQGTVTFEIDTNAKPVSYVYVSADGWESNSVNVVQPQPGKTEVVNVVLEPTSVTPTPSTEIPGTAGFGILAVFTGLGAVAVFRRK